jgi:hypothetical protein
MQSISIGRKLLRNNAPFFLFLRVIKHDRKSRPIYYYLSREGRRMFGEKLTNRKVYTIVSQRCRFEKLARPYGRGIFSKIHGGFRVRIIAYLTLNRHKNLSSFECSQIMNCSRRHRNERFTKSRLTIDDGLH